MLDLKFSVDESIKKHRPSLDNGETTLTKRHLLIMLAPESPHISKNFDDIYDESTYDSFHNFETGELIGQIGRNASTTCKYVEAKAAVCRLRILSRHDGKV